MHERGANSQCAAVLCCAAHSSGIDGEWRAGDRLSFKRRLQVPGTTMDPRWPWQPGRAAGSALVCPMPGFGEEDYREAMTMIQSSRVCIFASNSNSLGYCARCYTAILRILCTKVQVLRRRGKNWRKDPTSRTTRPHPFCILFSLFGGSLRGCARCGGCTGWAGLGPVFLFYFWSADGDRF